MIKKYELPDARLSEVLRYACCPEPDPQVYQLAKTAIQDLSRCDTGSICSQLFPVFLDSSNVDLGFTRLRSHSLSLHLAGCSHIIVFAATIGLEPDRRIARAQHLSPALASMMQAVCTDKIESLCDLFQSEVQLAAANRGNSIRTRFSPGYGDVPLSLQKDIFSVLHPQQIGLTLNSSLLMTPTKSVTAIIGIQEGIR